ncbi:MAG: pantoate--beta-alanine ligase [Myxococcota bacterium]
MRVVHEIHELQALADAERAAGRTIGLVPTMGALHAGHLALVAEARRRADRSWVSIFVNPAQFDDAADLEHYPCTLESDLARCREAGVDLVFAPRAAAMYAPDCETWLEVTELSKPLCGRARPGHFRGVATVVAKLLLAAKPHVAVFGEKDFQQLALIRRMVRDLNIDVEIAGVPTVREADGLALSSRNALLDPVARRQATALVRALDTAERAVAAGERDAARILQLAVAEIEKAPLAEIDYAELRDPHSLAPAPAQLCGAALLALAVCFRPSEGEGAAVRLIDNRVLRAQPELEE